MSISSTQVHGTIWLNCDASFTDMHCAHQLFWNYWSGLVVCLLVSVPILPCKDMLGMCHQSYWRMRGNECAVCCDSVSQENCPFK
jgi:hypothetical protein